MRSTPLVVAAFAGAFAAIRLAAVQPLPPPAGSTPPEPRLPSLLELRGDPVSVFYSEGALERAAHLQLAFTNFAETLATIAKRPIPLRIYVLSAEDWKNSKFARPYGLAQPIGSLAVALPAWGDETSIAEVRRILGGDPPTTSESLARGTPTENGSLAVADVLGRLEVARSFVSNVGLGGDEPWIAELLAHLVVRTGFERGDSGSVVEMVSLFDRIAAANGGARAFRFDDYRAGLSFERWLWFEAQFVRGADAIFVAEGERGARRLLAAQVKKREPFLRADLDKKYAGLIFWRNQAFAP